MKVRHYMNQAKQIELATQNRLDSAATHKLVGIINGLICDNELSKQEILFLSTWLAENKGVANSWPGSTIYRRVREVLADGVITEEEQRSLLKCFNDITGNNFYDTGSALPEIIRGVFDDDAHILFPNRVFVFTGIFLYGTRPVCEKVTTKCGGNIKDNITQSTNYLVIGSKSSPEWFEENYGRKIQKAAEMAESGDFDISIVREADWTIALGSHC